MKNRQRGRNGGKPRPPGGGPRNPNFDGGMRPRGNAQQLMEKFLAMARDASAMGDRVAAENYYQHADHYYRVLNARFEAQQQQNHQNQQNQQGYYNGQRRPDQGGNRFDRQGYQGEGQGDDQQGEQQNFQRGGYDQRPQQSYDQRPNYDQRNYQGNYQNEAPRPYEGQPQPAETEQQPANHSQNYQQPQPSRGQDADIGLPPQVLGLEDQGAEATSQGENQPSEGGGDNRQPRRRRGRGPGGPRHASPAGE